MKYYLIISLIILFLSACGSSSTKNNSLEDENNTTLIQEEKSLKISVFGNSPVVGLTYICDDKEEITDTKGEFSCYDAPVVFKVGALTIGTLDDFTNDLKVYPQDLLLKDREDIEDIEVVELERFLETLDDDSNITQYINITPKTANYFTQEQLFSELSSFEKLKLSIDIGRSYIPKEDVVEHLREALNLPESTLKEAIKREDSSLVEEEDIYLALREEMNEKLNYCKSVEEFIYPNGLEVVTFPDVRSDYFKSINNDNIPLHIAYNNGDYRVYSYMGEKQNIARYAVLGANIFKFDSQEGYSDISNDLNQELKNSTTQLFKWLLKKPKDINIFDENLTIIVNSDYMKDSLEDWLYDNSIEAKEWNITTDTSILDSDNYDMYIAVDESTLNYTIAMQHHKPVIVFQNWIIPNADMLLYFGIKWRWYNGLDIGDWESIDTLCRITTPEVSIFHTIENIEEEKLNFNYTEDNCPNSVGTIKCQDSLVLNDNGKTLAEEFSDGAKSLKNIIVEKDILGENIFKLSNQYNFIKLSILLGDKYRQNIAYPMDKETTDDTIFYKAYFSDYSISYVRENNKYQVDLGDFTHDVESLRDIATTTKTVTMTPTAYSEWSSTGLYCIAAKAVKITRLDDSNNSIQIKFNMLRDGTTKIWNQNSYTRPSFISSNLVTINKGKTYTVSSPIGGPIYIKWDGVDENATSFVVKFENIVEFPSLMDLTTRSIENFTNVIENSPFDWIDIKTSFVEIHTLKSKFDISYTTSGYFPYDGNLTQYLEDINQYTVLNNLNLAGFKGAGLSLNNEVVSWCNEYQLDCISDIHKKPAIQHINSDIHALCGDGCSGNPFDVDWSITPTGWGESHEYGHNLQKSRLKIYDRRSTEVSNNIFPLHTNWDYLVDHNISVHPTLKAPSSQSAYEQLQREIKNATPATIEHPMWSGDGMYDNVFARLSFYNQLVFINRSWDVFTKLYILDRLFAQAIKDEVNWDNNKEKLGFSSYTKEEASAINGNDFMAISLSKFTNKDYRDYFEAWGIELSDKAKNQIDTNQFDEVVSREFYLVQDDKLTKDFPTKTIPLDGVDEQNVTISGVCSSPILSECHALNAQVDFETPNNGSIYFVSLWDENGVTTSTNSGDEINSTLDVNVVDSDGNSLVLRLRTAKTITDNGVDGIKIAMNDTTESESNKTSLIIWIDANDNNLESGKLYHITEPIYINVKNNDVVINRIKVDIAEFMLPVSLRFNDVNRDLIEGFSEIENSSTFFVASTQEQGANVGVWENNRSYSLVTTKVKNDDGEIFDLKLRAKRDAYSTLGDSGVYVIMNSGIVYGKDNAFILSYNAEDNPSLSSNTHYESIELLIINAKLWHLNKTLRKQMQISIDITTP